MLSILAAMERSSCSVTFPAVAMPFISGTPSVRVPVLSKTTVSMVPACSRYSADFIKIPFSAPFPVPTMMATGVARPSAHGQEITSTEIALVSANENSAPVSIHTMNVTMAIPMTVGTKIPETLSAKRAIGAFEEEASSTRRIIFAKEVSLPTFSAVNLINPLLLIVAE